MKKESLPWFAIAVTAVGFFALALMQANQGSQLHQLSRSLNNVASQVADIAQKQSVMNESWHAAIQTEESFTEPKLGLSFTYPASWGAASFNEGPGDTGSSYHVTFNATSSPLVICGSSEHYTAGRGKYYCAYSTGYTLSQGKVLAYGESVAEPFKKYKLADGDIYVLDASSVSCDGPLCADIPGENQYYALLNLKGAQYPAAIMVFDSRLAPYESFEQVIKTIRIK